MIGTAQVCFEVSLFLGLTFQGVLQVGGHVQCPLGSCRFGFFGNNCLTGSGADGYDFQFMRMKVHMVPGQPQNLFPAQAEQTRQFDQNFDAGSFAEGEQPLKILQRVVMDLRRMWFGGFYTFGGVRKENALLDAALKAAFSRSWCFRTVLLLRCLSRISAA